METLSVVALDMESYGLGNRKILSVALSAMALAMESYAVG
jgi:hypothetical protein